MIAARGLVSRVTPLLTNNTIALQRRTLVSGPPSVRISFVEKVAHMVVIAGGMLAIPLYVLTNVRKYRSH